jgi:hypothetical protein
MLITLLFVQNCISIYSRFLSICKAWKQFSPHPRRRCFMFLELSLVLLLVVVRWVEVFAFVVSGRYGGIVHLTTMANVMVNNIKLSHAIVAISLVGINDRRGELDILPMWYVTI